jgi:hypothetical protein
MTVDKYDREKHQALVTVTQEALETPAMLRLAAQLAEHAAAEGLHFGRHYDDLVLFRDLDGEELAERGAMHRAVNAQRTPAP